MNHSTFTPQPHFDARLAQGSTAVTERTALPEKRPVRYPFAYGCAKEAEIREVLARVHGFVDTETHAAIVDRTTGRRLTDLTALNAQADIASGGLRLICYEMGVTCVGMLHAGAITADDRFTRYALDRLGFIADGAPYFEKLLALDPRLTRSQIAFYPVLRPETLDDAGSLANAFMRAKSRGLGARCRPLIERLVNHIRNGQYRLPDGTLARNRPHPNTLWLDDLYMSVPALCQYARLVADESYMDDAVQQVRQYARRMVDAVTGLFVHGYVEGVPDQPVFCWARANGWALLAVLELLDALPSDHRHRDEVLQVLRRQLRAIVRHQSGVGLWHQLLDRPDSFLETSASAMFAFGIARAINRGWVDSIAYGPSVEAAWGAVAGRVNARGQVEGTCVGTGLAFDPVFYHARPTSPFAAHAYGPLLLAGAEMILLSRRGEAALNDAAVHYGQNRAGVQKPLE